MCDIVILLPECKVVMVNWCRGSVRGQRGPGAGLAGGRLLTRPREVEAEETRGEDGDLATNQRS